MGVPLLQVLFGGRVAERLVRAHGVVGFLPLPEFAIQRRHFQRAARYLVELLPMGARGAFDGAIELGRARRPHDRRSGG
jgi:hypothetical protein